MGVVFLPILLIHPYSFHFYSQYFPPISLIYPFLPISSVPISSITLMFLIPLFPQHPHFPNSPPPFPNSPNSPNSHYSSNSLFLLICLIPPFSLFHQILHSPYILPFPLFPLFPIFLPFPYSTSLVRRVFITLVKIRIYLVN